MSDDITDLLGDAYADYPGDNVKPGVFCIAPFPYVVNNYYVIRPLDPNPQSSDHQRYVLHKTSPAGLTNGKDQQMTMPFKDLNLDVNEDLIITKIKRRPVVILSRAIVDERAIDSERFQDSFWCIPSYTLYDQFWHPQYDVGFIENVIALSYRTCFPLPYSEIFQDRYAMLRFDRIQPIKRDHLKPTPKRISKQWLLYLYEWTRFYMTGTLYSEGCNKIAENLNAARDALIEELSKNRQGTPKI